jgi:hypothetical protein
MRNTGVISLLLFCVSICNIKAQNISLPDKPVFSDITEYNYEYDDFFEKTNKIEKYTVLFGADNKYVKIKAGSVDVNDNYCIINETIYYKDGHTQSINNILKEYCSKSSNTKLKDIYDELYIHLVKLFENQIVLGGSYFDETLKYYKSYCFIIKPDIDKPEIKELDLTFTRNLTWFWVLEIFYTDEEMYLICKDGDIIIFKIEEDKLIQVDNKKYNKFIIDNIESHVIPFKNNDGFVELYDFSTGKSKILGKYINNLGNEAVLLRFIADNGKEYIIDQKTGKIILRPDESCGDLSFIDNGYLYYTGDDIVVCLSDIAANKLKQYRIGGTAISRGDNIAMSGNKLFITGYLVSFIIDINNGKVLYSAYTEPAYGNCDAWMRAFPFGNKEIIYATVYCDK